MRRSLGMQPKEVGVLRYEDTPRGRGKRELGRVVGSNQPRFHRSRDVDAATAKAGCNTGGDVLV